MNYWLAVAVTGVIIGTALVIAGWRQNGHFRVDIWSYFLSVSCALGISGDAIIGTVSLGDSVGQLISNSLTRLSELSLMQALTILVLVGFSRFLRGLVDAENLRISE